METISLSDFIIYLQARKTFERNCFLSNQHNSEYQNKGNYRHHFLMNITKFATKGIETCIRTPELEENHAIHNLWKHFNSKLTREEPQKRIIKKGIRKSESIVKL